MIRGEDGKPITNCPGCGRKGRLKGGQKGETEDVADSANIEDDLNAE
jgi:hypothetical protein